ncbi:MAG: CoA transferase [Dehalococcoidia bacterium]|nr:CoA transferase [Dehalococcoidia bacterium]
MEQALKGLKVIEFGEYIAAPYCGKLLADMGADVIKVERPPQGDVARRHGPFPGDQPHPERSGLFLFLNTNKRGVTLDPAVPTGRDLLMRLVKDADVLVQSYLPPQTDAWGLSYAEMEKLNPRLVMTSITPYGQTGPYRNFAGHDINCAAIGGVSAGNGDSDREPLAFGLTQCDFQGGLNASGATTAALIAREATGEGQHVDISIGEVLATLHVGVNLPTYIYRGIVATRSGRRGSVGRYPKALLPCKDGHFSLSAIQLGEWIRFIELMGTPEWSKNPRYRDRRAMAEEYPDEVDALVSQWTRQYTKEQIFQMGQDKHIPCAPVRTADETLAEPHLRERGFFVKGATPDGQTFEMPGPTARFSVTPWALSRQAPQLGEHNQEVFCGSLGLSRADLVALRRTGII